MYGLVIKLLECTLAKLNSRFTLYNAVIFCWVVSKGECFMKKSPPPKQKLLNIFRFNQPMQLHFKIIPIYVSLHELLYLYVCLDWYFCNPFRSTVGSPDVRDFCNIL